MVSISRAAPAPSRIWSVAFMISGPMPSPWATVIGVLVDTGGTNKDIGMRLAAQPSGDMARRVPLACAVRWDYSIPDADQAAHVSPAGGARLRGRAIAGAATVSCAISSAGGRHRIP